MINYSTKSSDQIDMITACLTENFVKEIYDLFNEKSYSAYIKSLSEILLWAHEFYALYADKLSDWKAFEISGDNIHNANSNKEFLIAWGHGKVRQFSIINENKTENFSGKIINMKVAAANYFRFKKNGFRKIRTG